MSLGETVAVGAFITDISDRVHVALKVEKGLEPGLEFKVHKYEDWLMKRCVSSLEC